MTRDELLTLREDADFEAKLAGGRDGRGALPQSLWETYSAMANTGGGRILLGAKQRGDGSLELKGIPDVDRVRKAIWDGVNNRRVVSQNLLENADGDYRCTSAEVRRMLAEAERDTRDGEILRGFGDRFRYLPEVERLALATALAEERVTNERLREISGEHPSDLTVLLRKLVEGEFLEKHGSGRASYYELVASTGSEHPQPVATDPMEGSGTVPLAQHARQQKAIEWIRERGSISPQEYRALLNISRAMTSRDLADLVRRNIVVRVGQTNATRYLLRE
jgi:predicted HTH transcriptional regulator